MNRTLKTEAIVLKKRSMPNQDKIVTLFTKDIGKLNVFAKGIKKITSRRLPHVQTANLLDTILNEKNDHYYLQETNLLSGFSQIKKDHFKMQSVYTFFFIIERLLPENQPEPDVYILTKKFLIGLSHSTVHNTQPLEDYLNKVLFMLGYSKSEKPLELVKAEIEEIIHEKIPELQL